MDGVRGSATGGLCELASHRTVGGHHKRNKNTVTHFWFEVSQNVRVLRFHLTHLPHLTVTIPASWKAIHLQRCDASDRIKIGILMEKLDVFRDAKGSD